MNVINLFNPTGLEYIRKERERLLILHSKQSREYESLVAEHNRLRMARKDEQADLMWQKLFKFLNEQLTKTAENINRANHYLNGGKIWE